MKKQILTNKQKKDIKYFLIITIIITITFELLKYFNQYNFTSFLAGEICMTIINAVRIKVYQGSDKE